MRENTVKSILKNYFEKVVPASKNNEMKYFLKVF
jgi:hypothetical protein